MLTSYIISNDPSLSLYVKTMPKICAAASRVSVYNVSMNQHYWRLCESAGEHGLEKTEKERKPERKNKSLEAKRPGLRGMSKLWKPTKGPQSLHRENQSQTPVQTFRLIQRPQASTSQEWASEMVSKPEGDEKPKSQELGLSWLEQYMGKTSGRSSSEDSSTKEKPEEEGSKSINESITPPNGDMSSEDILQKREEVKLPFYFKFMHSYLYIIYRFPTLSSHNCKKFGYPSGIYLLCLHGQPGKATGVKLVSHALSSSSW